MRYCYRLKSIEHARIKVRTLDNYMLQGIEMDSARIEKKIESVKRELRKGATRLPIITGTIYSGTID